MTGKLQGTRAVVTGASRGIGRAMAVAFAAEGAQVVAVARNGELLADLVAEIDAAGGHATYLMCDVTDADQVAQTCEAIADGGAVQVLVNNAGGNSFSAPVAMMRPSGWTKTQTLNVDSTFWMIQGLLPAMVATGGGSIINVASVAGLAGAPLMAHYGAAKAAILSLTRSLAIEVASSGVRVNALVPGWIETDLTDFLRHDDAVESSLLDRVPMQRWGTVEEIAAAAVFLASSDSSFMTGQSLVVDGGLSVMP